MQSQNLEINCLPVELRPAFPHLFPSPHIIPKLSNKPPLPTDCILQSATLSQSQTPSLNLLPSPTLTSLHSEPMIQPMSQLVG